MRLLAKSASTILPLLAVALTPALAQAQTADACGGIELTDITECHFEFEGGCKANCQPLKFTAACDGECNVSLDAQCTASCQGGCEADCQVDPGAFDCSASCRTDCEATIQAQCGTDQDCISYCQADCSSQCDAECNVVAPSANCQAKCEGSCSGSCEFDANASCSFSCQADLQGGCEVDCDEPNGALFCDGQYIAVQDLPACVQYLVDNFSVDLEYNVQASGTVSASGCSVSHGAQKTGFGLGLLFAATGLAMAARRRRRQA